MTGIDNFGILPWKTFRIGINNCYTYYNDAASGLRERYKSRMRSFRSLISLKATISFAQSRRRMNKKWNSQ